MGAKDERAARLAAQLRANLRKRKVAASPSVPSLSDADVAPPALFDPKRSI